MFGMKVNKTAVAESATRSVEENVCPAAGHPGDICQPGIPGTSPGAFESASFIAVDNTSGPSAGDVYVVDNADLSISKFDALGNLVSSWGSEGRLHSPGTPDLVGLGVDENGNVWTASIYPSGPDVFEFDGTGELIRSTGSYYNAGFEPVPSGQTYYSNAYENGFNGYVPFAADGARLPGSPVPGAGLALAPNGFLYTITGEDVSVYDPSSDKPIGEPFGFGELVGPSALAIAGTNNDVYVADSAAGDVKVYDALAPVVSTGPVENQDHTSATLTGQIEPIGRGEVTECRFEYGLSPSYGQEVPCSPAPPYSESADVSANLGGLTPEAEYHYRLVAKNGAGTGFGGDKIFVPHAVLEVKTEGASNVERAAATLNGSFDPDGLPTTYHFEYVEAAHYHGGASNPYSEGASMPVTEAGPISQSSKQSVEETIENLPLQTTYDYRLVAKNSYGTTYGQNETVETLPAVLEIKTEAANIESPESAILHGSYMADVAGGDTHCDFQYGSGTSYGHTTAEPPGLDQGSVTGLHNVEAELTGLASRHTYHYRLACSNSFGTGLGEDQSFETPEAPTIDGSASANLTKTTADLKAAINPQGFTTTYHFEYGTTNSYGESTPETEITENLSTDNAVEVELPHLERGVVYHFRVVATNKWGTTTSADETFNFYPPPCPNELIRQETNSSYLPDCRAYELVTPEDAGGVVFIPGTGTPSSSNAENPARFAFEGIFGAVPGSNSPDSRGDTYIATRTPTGWVTHYVGVLGSQHLSANTPVASDGLEKLLDFAESTQEEELLSPFAWEANGASLGRWPASTGTAVPNGETNNGVFQPSPDFSHLFISSSNVAFSPEGLTGGLGSAYDYNTVTGTTTLISRLSDGEAMEQAPEYNPYGTRETQPRSDFIESPNPNPEIMRQGMPTEHQPGISPNGSKILMGVPTEAPCHFSFGCYSPSPVHLYMRIADALTLEIAPGHAVDFVAMTADASKVFLTSEEQLTPEDHGTSSQLYMWSEKGEQEGRPLTLISKPNANTGFNSDSANCHGCGVEPVVTGTIFGEGRGEANTKDDAGTDNSIAAENGDIYFYSPQQLDGSKGITGLMNLYDYRDETLQYVTTVQPSPECNAAGSTCRNAPITRMQVSPDDSHAAFVTADQITSNDIAPPVGNCFNGANEGNVSNGAPPVRNCEEMYSYDPSTGKIVCVSCLQNGELPTHNVDASTQGLFMADDGRTFFSTREALVQTDTNQVEDVYEFVDGRPQLITTGTDAADRPGGHTSAAALEGGLAGVSANGTNAYFSTRDDLVPSDHNGQYLEYYDARSDGGFPIEPPKPPCESADECHSAGSSPPTLPHSGAGADLGGDGNVAPDLHTNHHMRKPHHKSKRRHIRHGNRGGGKS